MRNRIGLGLLLLALVASPVRSQDAPIIPQASAALEASHIFRTAGGGQIWSLNVANNNAAVRWVLIYDSTTVPADGATTPVKWIEMAATSSQIIALHRPWGFTTGVVFVCSTSGPFTKTITTDCGFSVEMQ